MVHRIIDTNVPLTAAGKNAEASPHCELECEDIVNRVLKGEIEVVLDDADSIITEYRNNMHPDPNGTRAGQFLMYLFLNKHRRSRIQRVKLEKNDHGHFIDYPDNGDEWLTEVPRCERFDPDDKIWVALALRFKRETGRDAPIVNAADRCWLAFESHLEAAGVKLEVLCRDERQRNGN